MRLPLLSLLYQFLSPLSTPPSSTASNIYLPSKMSLHLQLEGFDDPSDLEKSTNPSTSLDFRVFQILNDFLQLNTKPSLDDAAQAILALLPENAPESTEVWSAGTVIVEIAGQIPYHHLSQIKLATLIGELSNADKFTQKRPDEKGIRYRCQRLKEAVRDSYNGPNDENVHEWPNLNAFYAHLDARHIFGNNQPTFMIWTMRSAFEENPEDDPEYFAGMKDQCILAAAQYILWSGQEQFKRLSFIGEDVDPATLQDWKPGPLYYGHGGFTLDRWRFWKAGFRAAAEDSGIEAEARRVADAALIELSKTAPVLYEAGGTHIVRLSKALIMKGGELTRPCEAAMMTLIQAQTSIRVPKVHRVINIECVDPYYGEQCLIVMDFIEGETVETIWDNASEEQRKGITSTQDQWDARHVCGSEPGLQTGAPAAASVPPFRSNQLVLTHGDIAPRNLIRGAADGKVWLIDWGRSGIYPLGMDATTLEQRRFRAPAFTDLLLAKIEQHQVFARQLQSIMYGLTAGAFIK
ncbi:hypothetical protein HK57_00457 [Aspergillus ustus]|uniref:Aminoglycoside phosphotransferase domain-containing protein n=1 Tax=Aspergillus ustus TaxID=40382 RepID=A0A0C1BW58_ASPUT|nr:hypothetical protein HK57_00457 [Aspergillus ustus]